MDRSEAILETLKLKMDNGKPLCQEIKTNMVHSIARKCLLKSFLISKAKTIQNRLHKIEVSGQASSQLQCSHCG